MKREWPLSTAKWQFPVFGLLFISIRQGRRHCSLLKGPVTHVEPHIVQHAGKLMLRAWLLGFRLGFGL